MAASVQRESGRLYNSYCVPRLSLTVSKHITTLTGAMNSRSFWLRDWAHHCTRDTKCPELLQEKGQVGVENISWIWLQRRGRGPAELCTPGGGGDVNCYATSLLRERLYNSGSSKSRECDWNAIKVQNDGSLAPDQKQIGGRYVIN